MILKAKRDYYEILGVNKSADDAAIRKAYRKLAKKYHPDSNAGDAAAEEKFKEITEAYDVLSDKEKRSLYDRFGHAAFDGSFAGAGEGAGGGEYGPFGSYTSRGPGGQSFHYSYSGPFGGGAGGDVDMDDILKNLFGHGRGNGGGFDGFSFHSFGGDSYDGDSSGGFSRRGAGGQSRRGADINAEIEITFDEAAFGGKKRVSLQDSTGKVRSFEINIPAGIESGKSIRLKGKGRPGAGEPGDLMLKVRVAEKPGYRREGQDIYTSVKIPFTTAVFGGEVQIGTIYGKVLCKVKPGTQSGTKIRLKGKGIVFMNDRSRHGDQYAVVEIDVPQNLSPEAKKKLREFEEICAGRKKHDGAAA